MFSIPIHMLLAKVEVQKCTHCYATIMARCDDDFGTTRTRDLAHRTADASPGFLRENGVLSNTVVSYYARRLVILLCTARSAPEDHKA